MANTKITIDLSGVNKKISQKAFQRGQSAVANQALLDMSVYVPSRHGELTVFNGQRFIVARNSMAPTASLSLKNIP